MSLDIDFVRAQFPQCDDDPDRVFCNNAGGSYVAAPVIELLHRYDSHLRVQPYAAFTPSREAGEAMDDARRAWAEALNADVDELTFAPSSSAITYTMAHALGSSWKAGDEIIVTDQDHETNIGAWRRKAEDTGVTVRTWALDPATGLLDPEDLYALLSARTRWVFFTHCSNVMGTVHPVAEITREIHDRSQARVCVDAVAYAPHHIPDLQALGVDLYFFSLYKVFGPHQGLLYVRGALGEELAAQSHYFLHDNPAKRYNPAGPQHSLVAASLGVLAYFEALGRHCGAAAHGGRAGLEVVHELIGAHERRLAEPLLDYLTQSPAVQLLGKGHCRDGDRAPTIAFRPVRQSSQAVASRLQRAGIGTEAGHFYAPRALRAMGIDPADGVVRLSLVHYNTAAEVQRVLSALDNALVTP